MLAHVLFYSLFYFDLFILLLYCSVQTGMIIELLIEDNLVLPAKWLTKRPQELTPGQFLELTRDLYGRLDSGQSSSSSSSSAGGGDEKGDGKEEVVPRASVSTSAEQDTEKDYVTERVWRNS